MYSLVNQQHFVAEQDEDGIDDAKDPGPSDERVDNGEDDIEYSAFGDHDAPTDDNFADPSNERKNQKDEFDDVALLVKPFDHDSLSFFLSTIARA